MQRVLVIYHSQEYGHTEALAEQVARGIREAGAEAELINTNEAQRVDMQAVVDSDGLALGSPDYAGYVAGTIKQFFDDLYVARTQDGLDASGKPCVLFMTHGGGGRAIQPFRQLAHRLDIVAEPFVCRGRPAEDCPEAVELGRALVAAIENR